MTVETIVACLWCCIIAQLMISAFKQCLVRLYLHLLVGGLLFYLQYLCFLRIVVSSTYCGVQHVLCCVFFFVFLRTLCYQLLWIVQFGLPIRYSITFIYNFVIFITN
jgi:hypothetical protein